jgi:hypothetical protein
MYTYNTIVEFASNSGSGSSGIVLGRVNKDQVDKYLYVSSVDSSGKELNHCINTDLIAVKLIAGSVNLNYGPPPLCNCRIAVALGMGSFPRERCLSSGYPCPLPWGLVAAPITQFTNKPIIGFPPGILEREKEEIHDKVGAGGNCIKCGIWNEYQSGDYVCWGCR